MFYGTKPYLGGTTSKKTSPIVFVSYKPEEDDNVDFDIKRLIGASPSGTSINNESCFWLDGVVQSFAYLQIYNIFGEGLGINVNNNKEAEDKINAWNDHINNNGNTIEDYIADVWIDNTIHEVGSIWRVGEGRKYPNDPRSEKVTEIFRIPPETITIDRDSVNGWRRFIQRTEPYKYFKNYNEFLEGWQHLRMDFRYAIAIPDDPVCRLYISFFKRPPMSSVNHLIIFKRWIWNFLRKFSEKLATAVWIAYIGDPKTTVYPMAEQEMKEALTQVTDKLVKLRNFSAAAFPGSVRVEPWEPKNNGDIFLKIVDKLDEQILLGMRSSAGLLQSNSVYKGNENIAEMQIRFMEAVRAKIESALRDFYVANLVPDVNPKDINFIWQDLRVMNIEGAVKAYSACVESGVIRDAKERRLLASRFFHELSKSSLSDEESKKLDDQFVLLKAPSQPGDNTPNIAKGGKSGSPSKPKTASSDAK
jgi:hypothetical protein